MDIEKCLNVSKTQLIKFFGNTPILIMSRKKHYFLAEIKKTITFHVSDKYLIFVLFLSQINIYGVVMFASNKQALDVTHTLVLDVVTISRIDNMFLFNH